MKRKAKTSRKDNQIRIRLTRQQKDIFTRAAEREGLDVSSWLRAMGLRAAEEKAR